MLLDFTNFFFIEARHSLYTQNFSGCFRVELRRFGKLVVVAMQEKLPDCWDLEVGCHLDDQE